MRPDRLILPVLLTLWVGGTSAAAGTDVGRLMGFGLSGGSQKVDP